MTTTVIPQASCRVMTPDPLAAMVVRAIGATPDARWLEPSHGEGAFLRAIRATGATRQQVWARDLDPRPAESDKLAQSARGVDFLDPLVFPRARFDVVVGNPPYLAIERLRGNLRRNAAETLDLEGNPIGDNSNLWYAFVCKSMRLLLPGGSLGFVLPASAEFADYAKFGREMIRRHFRSVEVTRFNKPPFPGVLDGSVILIARGFQATSRRSMCPWSRRLCETIDDFRVQPARTSAKCPVKASQKSGRVAVGDIAKIRIGAVTGDASYFLMTDSERRAHRLPKSTCIPVLSRSKHLYDPLVGDREFESLLMADERVWLFRPRRSQLSHPYVKAYLRNGCCNRDARKIRDRDPWYETPLAGRADAFLSGMGSGGLALTLNRKIGLQATNTLFQVEMIDQQKELSALPLAIALMCESSRRQCERLRRHYAGGLKKLEPSDVAQVLVPWPIRKPSIRGYRKAVRHLRDGEYSCAKKVISDLI